MKLIPKVEAVLTDAERMLLLGSLEKISTLELDAEVRFPFMRLRNLLTEREDDSHPQEP